MALFGNVGDDYTRTGKGFLGRWSTTLSYIPILRNVGSFFGKIPFVSGTFGALLGYIDTAIETGQWLFQGKIGSAATAAVAGFVGTSVNFASDSTPFWWANAASGLATGESLGTHARAATESIIGSVTAAIGSKPQLLSPYTQGPGTHASRISAERGQNPDEAYARYASGEGGAHVNELQSALGRA